MGLLFCDGFDKYGTPTDQTVTANISAALLTEWTSDSTTSGWSIQSGLSAIGYALTNSLAATLTKTLATNYSRLIGGVRFASGLTVSTGGVTLLDAGTAQCSITLSTSGQIVIRTGGTSGTALATSTQSTSANATHYLEWDITFGSSASYQVWLDGVSILGGTGATKTSANSTASQVQLSCQGMTFDDLYLFDTSGSTNNAVLLTSPQIETQLPSGDSSVQFSFGAAVLGQATQGVSGTNAPGANQLFLRKLTTPALSCVLNSVACIPGATSAGANFKSVLYSDSAGSVGALLATGTQTTGAVSGTVLTSSFSSGQTLTSSTAYWLGFITDTSVALQEADSLLTGQNKANTYASGAPASPTALTSGDPSWVIYGNLTSTGANWFEENINPPPGDVSYVSDSTSGHEDLYSFPALTTPNPSSVYAVVVKGYIKRSDSGARTISMQCKSSGTDSPGASVSPGTSYGWIDANFETDPNTGSAWAAGAVNSATSGFKVAS